MNLRTRNRFYRITEIAKIFEDLVFLQDDGMSVIDSRLKIAANYNITIARVRQIEDVGIQRQWFPLNQPPKRRVA